MTAPKINPAQNRRLHQLINQLGLQDDKAGLVHHFTAKRYTSTKDMAEHQAQALIDYLAGLVPPTASPTAPPADAANRMRRKVFAIGRAIGWLSGETPADLAMNRAKLDQFLCARGVYKKPLNQYTAAELPKLVSQFEQIQRHYEEHGAGQAVTDLLAELNLPVAPAPRTRRPSTRKPNAR